MINHALIHFLGSTPGVFLCDLRLPWFPRPSISPCHVKVNTRSLQSFFYSWSLVIVFPDIFPALTKRDSKLASFRRRYLLLLHRGKVSDSLYFVLHFHDEMLVGVMHGLCAGIIKLEVLINTSSVALYRRLGTTTTQLTPLSRSRFLPG